ncbi:hypothetical protein D910_09393 [Dendroctonus ponderosae]|uniref:Protein N-terminal asparagine amidohydrolase n=1 Tax=Dendroctonus ponderosae TaxID=77166 RepID=U4UPI5_DENPD|nr:hypothetical protein D910_09393 [Dendroctonus ponderosae]
MVLVLNGVLQEDCPPDSRALYLNHPVYRDTAAQLLSVPNKVIGPVGLLYVLQRELAVTVPHDKNVNVLGSDDVTTCLIVVVRHSGSGAVALAHLDGSGIDEAVCTMIQRVQDLALGYQEGRIEVQLVGGFTDAHSYSEDIFFSIMSKWVQRKQPVLIKSVLDIYDCSLGLLQIAPFNYEPLRGVDLWLEQTDDFILQQLSTSPEVQPPHFVMQIRAALKYIQDNQFPAITVFRDNRPHYFRRDEHTGLWSPVRY